MTIMPDLFTSDFMYLWLASDSNDILVEDFQEFVRAEYEKTNLDSKFVY